MEKGEAVISETQLVRRHLSDLLDKKPAGSTPQRRVVNVLEFLMTTEPQPLDKDALEELAPFFIKGDDLREWYRVNAGLIHAVVHENPDDIYTVRYDVEKRLEGWDKSSWLRNCKIGRDLFPFSPDLLQAEMAMKLLYIDAMDTYESYRSTLADQESNDETSLGNPAA